MITFQHKLMRRYLHSCDERLLSMTAQSSTESLVASTHRAILGGLLSIFAIIGIGWVIRAFPSGNYVLGLVAVLLAVGATSWIGYLFLEGYRE